MKLSGRVLASSLGALSLLLFTTSMVAQASSPKLATGIWQGVAKVRDTDVPITIRITGSGKKLEAAFLNGPADKPDVSPASSVTVDGNHVVASFDYFARKLDATVYGDTLTGTYGTARASARAGAVPASPATFIAKRVSKEVDPACAADAPNISGSWEIATTSTKGEKGHGYLSLTHPRTHRKSSRLPFSVSMGIPVAFGERGTAAVTHSPISRRPEEQLIRSHRRPMETSLLRAFSVACMVHHRTSLPAGLKRLAS